MKSARYCNLFTKSHLVAIACCAAVVSAAALAAEDQPPPPDAPPVSEFAPLEPLIHQVNLQMESIGKSVNSARYSTALQTRVGKEASVLIVLFTALGLHDEDSPLNASAPRLAELAEELVAGAADQAKAKAAFAALDKGMKEGAEGGTPLTWEKRAALGLLMKQVTTLNSKLNSNTRTEARFAAQKDAVAAHAVALAVIGQAAIADTHEVKDPTMIDEWYKYAAEMRDAAGAVGKAIAANDLAAVTAAKGRLKTNCDACHQAFRLPLTGTTEEAEE